MGEQGPEMHRGMPPSAKFSGREDVKGRTSLPIANSNLPTHCTNHAKFGGRAKVCSAPCNFFCSSLPYVRGSLNNRPIKFLIDSGASASFIPAPKTSLTETSLFNTVDGKPFVVSGSSEQSITLGGHIFQHPAYGADLGYGILGTDFLTKTGALICYKRRALVLPSYNLCVPFFPGELGQSLNVVRKSGEALTGSSVPRVGRRQLKVCAKCRYYGHTESECRMQREEVVRHQIVRGKPVSPAVAEKKKEEALRTYREQRTELPPPAEFRDPVVVYPMVPHTEPINCPTPKAHGVQFWENFGPFLSDEDGAQLVNISNDEGEGLVGQSSDTECREAQLIGHTVSQEVHSIRPSNMGVPSYLKPVLKDFSPLFDEDLSKPVDGKFAVRIPLFTDTPPIPRYRVPLSQHREIKEKLNKMIEAGILVPSSSPLVSPLVVVKKADGSLRPCVDFRAINGATTPDSYPIPRIDDLLSTVKGSIFSSIDLKDGFLQVPVHPEDAYKTAVSTPWGAYEFTRMPFGLKRAPSAFQRLMDTVLRGVDSIIVYIDDILIFSDSPEEHA